MKKQVSDSKIRKVLFNEVTFGIAVIAAFFSCYTTLTNRPVDNTNEIDKLKIELQTKEELSAQITNLKDNHLHTLENKVNNIEAKVDDQNEKLIELKTMLNERLPVKN